MASLKASQDISKEEIGMYSYLILEPYLIFDLDVEGKVDEKIQMFSRDKLLQLYVAREREEE